MQIFLFYSLKTSTVSVTAPSVLRQFVTSIFIYTQATIKEGGMTVNDLPLHSPLMASQSKRLYLIGRMRIALELCGWLNDSSLSLQATVTIYHLLVPLIQYDVPTRDIVLVRHCVFVRSVYYYTTCVVYCYHQMGL